jgi:glycosyltransferase involved in cell wall biosynthesis
MNIAVLTNDYPPSNTGGSGVIAEKQVEGLRARGHEVRVWHEQPKWFAYPAITRLFFHLKDIFSRRALVSEVTEHRPDLIITHNMTGLGFGTAWSIREQTGAAWIHVLHDVQLFEPSGTIAEAAKNSLWQRFWTVARQKTFGRPDLVISPTSWLIDAHHKHGWFAGVPHEILPNPGLPEQFALRHPGVPFRLLFAGGVSKAKGFELVKRMRSRLGNEYEIHIVGDTSSSGTGNGLIYHGRLSRDEVMEQMKEADLLLVPSQIVENQPTVILEAASLGLPVVASDIGGVRETIGKAGVSCSPNSLEEWLVAIQHFRDPAFYQQQATLMFELCGRYDPKRHLDRLNYLCTGTVNRKTRT